MMIKMMMMMVMLIMCLLTRCVLLCVHSLSTKATSSLSLHNINGDSQSLMPEQNVKISLEWVEYYGPQNSRHSTPVLFLHGLLGSKRNFESLGKMLGTQLEEKRRILGVDLR